MFYDKACKDTRLVFSLDIAIQGGGKQVSRFDEMDLEEFLTHEKESKLATLQLEGKNYSTKIKVCDALSFANSLWFEILSGPMSDA